MIFFIKNKMDNNLIILIIIICIVLLCTAWLTFWSKKNYSNISDEIDDLNEETESNLEILNKNVLGINDLLETYKKVIDEKNEELNKYKAAHIFKEISEGMVDTDVEKLAELTEDVEYDTDEQYKEKLNIIKNSYFKSDKKEVDDNKKTAGTNNPVVDGKSDDRMDSIMSAISNSSKR